MHKGRFKTKEDYIKRINTVLDFIDNNLEGDLRLSVLSNIAQYSKYHFHRVFSTIVGESVTQYVNRKRVERIAAILLTGSGKELKELAYNFGFNSESSFSRTFRRYYGICPTTFKTEGKEILSKIGIVSFSIEKYICSIDMIKNWIEMNADIVITELQDIKVAGIAHIGEFDKIADMYHRLMRWAHKKKVLDSTDFKAITIYHDNPNVTVSSKVRYSACVTIKKDIEAEAGIRPLTIRQGIYAVGRFEIKAAEISRAWQNFCVWIIENGYTFKDGDYFEMYHNDHTTHPEKKNILDICIPLEKTQNIKLNKLSTVYLNMHEKKKSQCETQLDYHELIKFMKELRAFFTNEHDFKTGNVYQGNPDFSYFSLTTAKLKKDKLKFVIILNHRLMSFSIWLSGQNKRIRKKYWHMFKDSDWDKYHIVESINNSLSILDHTIVKNSDFDNRQMLIEQIEREALQFINELADILEC